MSCINIIKNTSDVNNVKPDTTNTTDITDINRIIEFESINNSITNLDISTCAVYEVNGISSIIESCYKEYFVNVLLKMLFDEDYYISKYLHNYSRYNSSEESMKMFTHIVNENITLAMCKCDFGLDFTVSINSNDCLIISMVIFGDEGNVKCEKCAECKNDTFNNFCVRYGMFTYKSPTDMIISKNLVEFSNSLLNNSIKEYIKSVLLVRLNPDVYSVIFTFLY